MRIQIASDLHLEYLEEKFPDFRGIEPCDADVLILAGDISSGTRVFDLFSNWPYPVVYVPGNHEFYNANIDDVLAEFQFRSATHPNIAVLSPGTKVIHDVRFVGTTLWTDFDVFGPENRDAAMRECTEKIIDYSVIRNRNGEEFGTLDARDRHTQELAWLKYILATPFSGKTVVVTHHAPHPLSMDPRFTDELTSANFVSNVFSGLPPADLYVHGHVHCSADYLVDGRHVVANPMGYCRGIRKALSPADLSRENSRFDPSYVVEI